MNPFRLGENVYIYVYIYKINILYTIIESFSPTCSCWTNTYVNINPPTRSVNPQSLRKKKHINHPPHVSPNIWWFLAPFHHASKAMAPKLLRSLRCFSVASKSCGGNRPSPRSAFRTKFARDKTSEKSQRQTGCKLVEKTAEKKTRKLGD